MPNAPMMTSGFDPLLSQMYSPQETVDQCYTWYSQTGEYVAEAPSTAGPSYPYEPELAFPQYPSHLAYVNQPFIDGHVDGFFSSDGTYTDYGSWPYDASAGLSDYEYQTPVDPATAQPMFPFACVQDSPKYEVM